MKRVYTVTAQDQGQRLHRFLQARAGLSPDEAEEALRAGRVTVDGRRSEAGERLRAGARVVVRLRPAGEPGGAGSGAVPEARPTRAPIVVPYRDAQLIVVDKPAGLPVQPGLSGGDSLIERLRTQLAADAAAAPAPPYVGQLHRLDADASGLVLFTLDRRLNAPLAAAFRDHSIGREYLALVRGELLAPLRLEHRIARARKGGQAAPRRVLPASAPAGALAVTHVRPLERLAGRASAGPHRPEGGVVGWTLVEARLETGRTHQIRAQLAAAGHPLAGDRLYGRDVSSGPDTPRLFLHAVRVSIPRLGPDRSALEVESPLPPELEAWLARLRSP